MQYPYILSVGWLSTSSRWALQRRTQEEIDQARAAKLERESRSGRRRSSRQGGSPRSASDVSQAAKDAVDVALVQPAVKVAKKAKKVVKKVDPEVEARRKAKWTKFNMRQEERHKILRKHNQKLGDLVESLHNSC